MSMSKIVMAAALGLAVLMPVAAGAQKPAKPIALTALDYIEIKMLVNRYAFAVDTGSNNGYDYADLFAADGEFMRPYAKGRDQLAALARGRRLGPANTVHYIMNHVIEPTPEGAIGKEYLIELNWDLTQTAQAGQAGQAGRVGPGGQAGQAVQSGPGRSGGSGTEGQGRGGRGVDQRDQVGRRNGELARTGGHYEDVYVKTPDGWRFKKRDFVPSKTGADAAPLPPPRIPAETAQDAAAAAAAPPPTVFNAPTKQSTLTAMDYIEIQKLVSSYGHALDSGYGSGENGEPYANLYTKDAAFAGAAGHDQLAALARQQPRGPEYVRHYLTNHVIEPSPDGVKGKEFLAVIDIGENGKPSTLFLGGHYEETYEKTSDGWRFKTRRLITPRSGPQP